MATMTVTSRQNGTTLSPPAPTARPVSIPRALRKQAEQYLAMAFPFMDSPVFKQRNL